MNVEQHKGFRQGLEEFNTERFFEAHEAWEEVWLASTGTEKRFLQGIIQIAAAFIIINAAIGAARAPCSKPDCAASTTCPLTRAELRSTGFASQRANG